MPRWTSDGRAVRWFSFGRRWPGAMMGFGVFVGYDTSDPSACLILALPPWTMILGPHYVTPTPEPGE